MFFGGYEMFEIFFVGYEVLCNFNLNFFGGFSFSFSLVIVIV